MAGERDMAARGRCPTCGQKLPVCRHRSPLNYDRTRYATCLLLAGHDGKHRAGVFVWTDRTMPYRERANA